jgi:hypothetical protein
MAQPQLPSQPQLYDTQTGQPLQASEADIPTLLSSGKAAFMKGAQIPVLDPTGRAGTIPSDQAHAAFAQGYQYEPMDNQQARADKTEYGEGITNEALAGAAGAARGLSLGLSDEALTQSGLVEPETLAKLQKYNPKASVTGQIGGAIAPILLSGGAAAPAEAAEAAAGLARYAPSAIASRVGAGVTEAAGNAIGSQATKGLAAKIAATAVAKGAGSAVEGALYGAGNALTEHALGDPDMTAQKAAAQIGYGALFGGGVGALLGAGEGAYLATKAGKAAQATAEVGQVGQEAQAELAAQVHPSAAPQPNSFDEMAARNAQAPYMAISPEVPAKKALLESMEVEPEWQFPVTRAHISAMDNPVSYDRLKMIRESDGELGTTFRSYESNLKAEGVRKIQTTIDNVAPGYRATPDATEAGTRLIGAFTKGYEADKKALKDAFTQFDEVAKGAKVGKAEILENLRKSVPNLPDYLQSDAETGALSLAKYKSTMAVSSETHKVLSDLVDAINSGDTEVSSLRNLRDHITIDWANPTEARELQTLKKNLMDLMEEHVQKAAPDLAVRDTFKRYAQNEQSRELLERVLGGKLSDRLGILKQIKPEEVMDRIFRNTATVKAAKDVLEGPEFQKALADHLAEQMAKATKDYAFSSRKFGTYLINNSDSLQEAFKDIPQTYQRLKAVNNILRLVPDEVSINPSGTAKTALGLVGMLQKITHYGHNPAAILMDGITGLADKGKEILQKQQTLEHFNALLEGSHAEQEVSKNAVKATTLKKLEDMTVKTTKQIKSSVSSFLKHVSGLEVPASVNFLEDATFSGRKYQRAPANRDDAYQKRFKEVSDYASNPSALVDKVSETMKHLDQNAPNVSQAMIQTVTRGTQFLYEKAPKNPYGNYSLSPASKKWKPSDSAMATWERYAAAVDDPMGVIKDFKHGHISSEAVEALKTVYPKLHQEFVSEITDQLTEHKEDIPYQKRLQLSIALQMPMDETATPQFIQAMQANLGQTNQALAGQYMNQGSVPAGRASKIKASDHAQTDTERVLGRG